MAISQITSNSIAAGAVSASDLADGSITADKIASGAVTNAKIDTVAASKITGQLTDANMAPGSVIQVVQAQIAPTTVTTTSSTPVNSSLSVSITPSSASSKILIFFSSYGAYVPSSNQQMIGFLYRNGSDVTPAGRGWFDVESVPYTTAVPVFAQAYDSPASTSAQTYAVYFRSVQGGNCYLLNNGPNLGSLQLVAMEIAA